MNILLLGCNGQLGWELQRTLPPLGKITSLDIDQLDLTDKNGLIDTVRTIRPDLIINASAYTNVDKAESENDLAMIVNRDVPGILAEEAKKCSAVLVHFSTDYVFDGMKGKPYVEQDTCNAINVYGQSKRDGEIAVQNVNNPYLILRTSWVYSLRKTSFISKVIEWAKNNETIRVVTDQIGSPTWARMLAEVSSQLLSQGSSSLFDWSQEYSGLYHLGGLGSVSRFDIAKEVLSIYPQKETLQCQEILPALTEDFPTPAQRPLFTSLNCDLFTEKFHINLPDWKESLRLALK